jgi:hypothetical protein
MTNVAHDGRRLQWNASANCFRCYTGSEKEITLYRRTISTGGNGGGTTPTPEPTPTPTEVPPYVRTIEFSGNAVVDAQLRWQAEELFGIEEEPCYVSYTNGIWFSTVFQKGEEIYPVVYNLDTAEQVHGSGLIKDTYFAIIKERLQTYMAECYPTETKDDFLTYKQVYQAEDYQKFYLTESQLVFCFDANTLTAEHPAFSYAVDLSEAQAFFKYNLDGTKAGIAIRELDPNKPMVAFTFAFFATMQPKVIRVYRNSRDIKLLSSIISRNSAR